MGLTILDRHHTRTFGQGTVPMIFAHGFGCDQNMWRFITPAFEPDYRITVFDYVGHGESARSSDAPEPRESLDAYATDVLDIAAALDIRDGVFVGHSVSAMIGALAAAREPHRFSTLIMIAPSPRYINDTGYVGGFAREDVDDLLDALDSNYLGWSSTMAPVIMGQPKRPELASELTNSFCRTDPEVARRFARLTFLGDNRADLPRVHARTLVLQCANDVIAPESVGRFVHEQLPRSELFLMKATGHCPNLSAPEETIAAMNAFLAHGDEP